MQRIRNPHAYRKAAARKEVHEKRAVKRAQHNILRYLDRYLKVLAADSWSHLQHELVHEPSVTHCLPHHFGHAALISRAIDKLLASGKIAWHEDENGIVLARVLDWPPQELRADKVTVEDLDPEFDWAMLSSTRFRHGAQHALTLH